MKKRKFWEEPGWECVSRKRPYPWNVSDWEARNSYQDILSTWEALLNYDAPSVSSEAGLKSSARCEQRLASFCARKGLIDQ
jgi:hypothetical protein